MDFEFKYNNDKIYLYKLDDPYDGLVTKIIITQK